ncbi:MAG TPA: serine hydrolase domain-containing protein [Vicinamibacterales bacterium]|nr:serine hydrolase domain-containing protein [Vicinamibacterales bacterium]
MHTQDDLSLEAWSARLATVPLTAEPGTRFEYGLGADIAGAVIERVSGTSLADFLKTRIFVPLEMADTGFLVPPDAADRLARVCSCTVHVSPRSWSTI